MAAVVSGLFTVFLESEGGGLDFEMMSGMSYVVTVKAVTSNDQKIKGVVEIDVI